MAPDRLDQLSAELNGMTRDQIAAVAGTAPAAEHMCPLCGGRGSVTDAALREYVAQLQLVDAKAGTGG
jgi:hypothetical protein